MAQSRMTDEHFQPGQGKDPDPALAELSVSEVRRLLEFALPLPPRSRALRLAWSHWRRASDNRPVAVAIGDGVLIGLK